MKKTPRFVVPDPVPWDSAEACAASTFQEPDPPTHPCNNCLAPCCWTVTLGHFNVLTEDELDKMEVYLRYRGVVVWAEPGASFTLAIVARCHNFDTETFGCRVHGTDEQPRVCGAFDAQQCWYRDSQVRLGHVATRLNHNRFLDYRARIPTAGGMVMGFPDLEPLPSPVTPEYDAETQIVFDANLAGVDPAHRTNFLYYLSNFEGCRVVRTPEAWRFMFRTRRLSGHELADCEVTEAGEVAGFGPDDVVQLDRRAVAWLRGRHPAFDAASVAELRAWMREAE